MQTIWMWRERMEPPFSPWSTHAVTGEDGVLRLSKPSSGLSDVSIDPVASPVSDFRECANSPSSSLLLPPDELTSGPLYEMSSIMKQLPIKRGLSKHFEGKSQSFTSLSDVKCLEDLVKPDKSLKKKLKSCKSHRGELGNHRACFHKASFRTMSKKASKAFSSTDSKSNSRFFGCRLQIPSGGTRCHHTQTPLLNG